MLQVDIGKINLVGNRIMPNIFCVVSFGTEVRKSKTHYGTSHATLNERFQFTHGRTQWMHLEIRHKQGSDSSSGDEQLPSSDSTLMCSCDEDISNVKTGIRNLVKLLGKPDYCNSGLVQYTVRRSDNPFGQRNILEAESLRSQSRQEEGSEYESEEQSQSQSEGDKEGDESGSNNENRSLTEELQQSASQQYSVEQKGPMGLAKESVSPTNKANFRRKQFAPQYEVASPTQKRKQLYDSGNSSFSQNFSKEERARFEFDGEPELKPQPKQITQPKQTPTSDQEGVRFISNIAQMLGESEKHSKPQSRTNMFSEKNSKPESRSHSNNGLNSSKMSEEDMKFMPAPSPKFNAPPTPKQQNEMSFGDEEGQTNGKSMSFRGRNARIRSDKVIRVDPAKKDESTRKLSIIREGSPDKLTDNENVRQRKKMELANAQLQGQAREGHRLTSDNQSGLQSQDGSKTEQDYRTIENLPPHNVDYGHSQDDNEIIDRRALDKIGVYKLNPNIKKERAWQRRQKRPWNKKFEFSEKYNTEGNESAQDGSQGLGTEQPYHQDQNSMNRYLDSSYFSGAEGPLDKMIPTKKPLQNKLNSFKPITHSILPGKYLIFGLSCNVHYLRNKNFRNKMSLDLLRDDVKIAKTSLCAQKFPPYEWSEYFQVQGFDELKFLLMYHEPEVPNQSERQESVHERVKQVLIGTAVLKKADLKQSMSFNLPMQFKGLKMGQLSLKLNYMIDGVQLSQDKFNKLENIAVQTANKHSSEPLYKAVSLPGIAVKPEPKMPLPHTTADQHINALRASKEISTMAAQLKQDIRVQLSPPKLIYPRSKAGFITPAKPALLNSTSIAKMYDREPEADPQTLEAAKPALHHADKRQAQREQIQQTLNLNTIIFKNLDLQSPVHDTFLVIEYAGSRVETQKIHEKDILWTKQNIVGNFTREDSSIQFSVYEEVNQSRTLLGKNKLFLADIRPKHRMYSYKLPMFSSRNQVIGELLLHYEFARQQHQTPTINNRERLLSCSIDNNESKMSKLRYFNASQQKSMVQRYVQKVESSYNGSQYKQGRRRHRQPFYYTGKNVKFGQAPRFRNEKVDESIRSLPGPGSYCLPSVFDRHKVIE